MSTTVPNSNITCTTLPAPAWATDGHLGSGGDVLWSHKVELEAMEVDGPESMTVETCAYDNLTLLGGTTIRRGSTEIVVTRHDSEDADVSGDPLRFKIANARKFAATILAMCDAVEGTTEAAAA